MKSYYQWIGELRTVFFFIDTFKAKEEAVMWGSSKNFSQ